MTLQVTSFACDCPCFACAHGRHAECRWPDIQAAKHVGLQMTAEVETPVACVCPCLSCANGSCLECFYPMCDDFNCTACTMMNAGRAYNDGMLLAGLWDCECQCDLCALGQCSSCRGFPQCRRGYLIARQADQAEVCKKTLECIAWLTTGVVKRPARSP